MMLHLRFKFQRSHWMIIYSNLDLERSLGLISKSIKMIRLVF